jgi:hypothetical protein
MAQPQMARITCSRCGASYDSEHELRDHMQAAHREVGSEQSLDVRTEAKQSEEYIQPDEEKEAGGEG